MDKAKREQIIEMVSCGRRPTEVFRAILAEVGTRPTRMDLFRNVKELFDVRVEMLSFLGAWNFWPDGTIPDDEIDREFANALIPHGKRL